MPILTAAQVREQIASGATSPVYLLQGEDEIEKSGLAHEFEEIVDEGLRAFNVERIHAGDAGNSGERLAAAVAAVIDSVRTLPMMSPRRIVIVFQAEGLLVPKRESEAAERALAELDALIRKPEPLATLVLVAGPLDKRSRMWKTLSAVAAIVPCGVIETLADAERWIRNRIAAGAMQIEPAAARLLAERGGTDVKRLRNDVERLLLYALGQKSISVDDVREIAGPAALQDDWAMTNAIEAGDDKTALRQLALILDSGAPPEKVLGQLGWLVRSKFPAIAPHGVRQSIDAVFRTDLDLKGQSGMNPRILLERLVVELCAGRKARSAGRYAALDFDARR